MQLHTFTLGRVFLERLGRLLFLASSFSISNAAKMFCKYPVLMNIANFGSFHVLHRHTSAVLPLQQLVAKGEQVA